MSGGLDLSPPEGPQGLCDLLLVLKSRVTSSSAMARAERAPWGQGWPTGDSCLGRSGGRWVDTGQNGLFLPAATGFSETGAVTGWGWDPVHPVAPLDCAWGSGRLLCRVLRGSLLVGPCASFLGCSAGVWALLAGRRGCLALGQVERCSARGMGLLLCEVRSCASSSMGRCWRRPGVQGRWVGHRSHHGWGLSAWLLCAPLALVQRAGVQPGGKGRRGSLCWGCLACAGTETHFPSATQSSSATFTLLGQETLGCGAWSPLLLVATWVVCTCVLSAGWRSWVWCLLGHAEDAVSLLFFPAGSMWHPSGAGSAWAGGPARVLPLFQGPAGHLPQCSPQTPPQGLLPLHQDVALQLGLNPKDLQVKREKWQEGSREGLQGLCALTGAGDALFPELEAPVPPRPARAGTAPGCCRSSPHPTGWPGLRDSTDHRSPLFLQEHRGSERGTVLPLLPSRLHQCRWAQGSGQTSCLRFPAGGDPLQSPL